ncbi:MAG: hypothetical protein ISR69_11470 [Gammaproteobacteria bacterium]|nr:hypothetical protein [Gammaproteobacteria bacterium]
MPVLTLFFSFIVAAISGIALHSIYAIDNQVPVWVNQIIYGIMLTGLIAAVIDKNLLCSICGFVAKIGHFNCHCHPQSLYRN